MADIHQAFQSICALGPSVVDDILAIQQHRFYQPKAWSLRLVEEDHRRTACAHDRRYYLRYSRPSPYIAVSCPWQLPSFEDQAVGRYQIERTDDIEIRMPHDLVLDRVTTFAAAMQCPFWIDKLCINQDENSSEKSTAIQSMDLVYKNSKITLGLLFVRLDMLRDVETLHLLLQGYCVNEESQAGQYRYSLNITWEQAEETLEIVYRITSDEWWHRAWIFQEEYLSGLRMVLLIRSSLHLTPVLRDTFGDLPGELEVDAVAFREEATKLCLALRSRSISSRNRDRCREILRRAGKYNRLLDTEAREGSIAMSPIIFGEIGGRRITEAWDLIPIACNACDYAVRLDAQSLRMEQGRHSLSLAILTIYILNGEILRHDWHRRTSSDDDDDIFHFLKRSTLKVDPPLAGEKGLTFLKHCRLPDVTLSSSGLHTKGVLWKLGKKFRVPPSFAVPNWMLARMTKNLSRCGPRLSYSLSLDEIHSLWRLVSYLLHGASKSYRAIADDLISFLEGLAPEGYDDDWSYRHIMNLTATCLARAIERDQDLCLGCVARSTHSPYSAIFIMGAHTSLDASFSFTSWACQRDSAENGLLMQDCSKYASLQVEVIEMGMDEVTIVPHAWINGLCFFSNGDAKRARIPWHKSLTGSS